jgi:hypothetical protein
LEKLGIDVQHFRDAVQRNWVPLTLSAVVFLGLGSATVLHGMPMSPFDEWVYLDYLFKIPTQFIVYKGEYIGHDALAVMACFGEIPFGPMGAECTSNLNPADFPYGGITSADPYSPLFFFVTWLVGHVFQWIPGIGQVVGWRLVGLLWLASGIWVFYKLGRAWKVPHASLFTAGLLLIATPYAYWTFTYVSTDAPSFLCGAVLLLTATKIIRGESRGYLLIVLSIIATLFKVTNVLAVFLAALFIVAYVVIDRRSQLTSKGTCAATPSRTSLVTIAAIAAVCSIATQLLWTAINRSMAVSNLSIDQGISSDLTWYKLVELISLGINSMTMTIPVNGLPGLNALPLPAYAVAPLSWVAIAGVVSAFWAKTRNLEKRAMIIAGALGVFTFGALLALMLQIATQSYFDLPPRYMGPLLPVVALLISFGVRDRTARNLLNVYGLALVTCFVIASAVIAQTDLTT